MDPMDNKEKRWMLLCNIHHMNCIATCAVMACTTQCSTMLSILFDEESCVDKPISESTQHKYQMRMRLLENLTRSDTVCHNIIRMRVDAYLHLCKLLEETGRVRASQNCNVQEKVAKCLYLLAHDVRNRELSFIFRCSGQTISNHFHEVLRGIISLYEQFIVQHDGSTVPPEIQNNKKLFPYFKDCIGAIDGTHIRVKVPSSEAARYRGRKDWPTTNVLAACGFNLRFTYVLAGWEGTVSDSRILKNAIIRSDKLAIPEGKYYLGDAGFGIKKWLITPYRGTRYHLKEYTNNAPRNACEIFNHRHASARSAIERTFGVLKKRFPIVASGTEPHYPIDTHIKIILACCVLHNYLMGVDPDATIIEQVDQELLRTFDSDVVSTEREDEDSRQGILIRDNMANAMWNDYIL